MTTVIYKQGENEAPRTEPLDDHVPDGAPHAPPVVGGAFDALHHRVGAGRHGPPVLQVFQL